MAEVWQYGARMELKSGHGLVIDRVHGCMFMSV